MIPATEIRVKWQFFFSAKKTEVDMETQHFRLESERLGAENRNLENRLRELGAKLTQQEEVSATNQTLRDQIDRHKAQVADAHAQGKLALTPSLP